MDPRWAMEEASSGVAGRRRIGEDMIVLFGMCIGFVCDDEISDWV